MSKVTIIPKKEIQEKKSQEVHNEIFNVHVSIASESRNVSQRKDLFDCHDNPLFAHFQQMQTRRVIYGLN